MEVGEGSAMERQCIIQLPHAHPTMHCIPLVVKVNLQSSIPTSFTIQLQTYVETM